jgi:DNA-binding NtrC family response regulator
MLAQTTEVVKKILLIGKNPDVAFFTGLQQQGYEVAACESPMKAWCLARVFRPHFIIVHFRQPARRDIAALQECHAMAEGVPIIITTSTPGTEAVMKALEEGATAFLSLPVEPAVVKKFLDRLDTAHK